MLLHSGCSFCFTVMTNTVEYLMCICAIGLFFVYLYKYFAYVFIKFLNYNLYLEVEMRTLQLSV